MRLGEALYWEMTGGRSPRTEVASWGDAIGWFLGRSSSVAGAAREAGVPRSTFRGWLHGRQPSASRSGAVVGAAVSAQRRSRMSAAREDRIRGIGVEYDVEIGGTYEYDGRQRAIAISSYLDPIGDDLADAFLDGEDLEVLARTFWAGISGAPFYETHMDPNAPAGQGFDWFYVRVG